MSDNTRRNGNRNWNPNRDYDEYDSQPYSQNDYSRGERRQNQRFDEAEYPPETSNRPYRTDMPHRDVGQYVEPGSSWSSDQGRAQYGNSYGNNSNWQRQGQHTGRGPQGWQRSDDRITEDVNERLTQHGDIDATNIQVRVSKGEVTLDGTVDSRWTKRAVEDTVEGISGVKHIQNNLRVNDSNMGQGSNNTNTQRSGTSTNGGNSSSGNSGQNQQPGQQSDLSKSRQSTKTANPN